MQRNGKRFYNHQYPTMTKTFLQAEWRKLAMVNYAVDPKVLMPYLPSKTELDLFNGKCYVSLVGFMFLNTKLMGFRIPFHTDFEEVNLRFYVRYHDGTEWKRGTVFIKEIVPKFALTFVANTVYKEHYETMPMQHYWEVGSDQLVVEYRWKKQRAWNAIKLRTTLELMDIAAGSEEEFITEHYWGYTKVTDHRTSEYGVEHPRWQVYRTLDATIEVDFGATYGPAWQFLNKLMPASVLLAEGSEIVVKGGKSL